jgi:hypothetical protein
LTIGAPLVTVLTADPVEIGTWSPTSMVAVWLLSTISLGADSTVTSVTWARAFRVAVIGAVRSW